MLYLLLSSSRRLCFERGSHLRCALSDKKLQLRRCKVKTKFEPRYQAFTCGVAFNWFIIIIIILLRFLRALNLVNL